MPKFVRSSKGEMVDFSLLKLKEKMATNPPPVEVSERTTFIDNKLQRRVRNIKNRIQEGKEVLATKGTNIESDTKEPESVMTDELVTETKPRKIRKRKIDDKTIEE